MNRRNTKCVSTYRTRPLPRHYAPMSRNKWCLRQIRTKMLKYTLKVASNEYRVKSILSRTPNGRTVDIRLYRNHGVTTGSGSSRCSHIRRMFESRSTRSTPSNPLTCHFARIRRIGDIFQVTKPCLSLYIWHWRTLQKSGLCRSGTGSLHWINSASYLKVECQVARNMNRMCN
jgi:hypothetical protein